MEDIALETINDISNSQYCLLVIHVFSSGGAFLWEAMRCILYCKTTVHPLSNFSSKTNIDPLNQSRQPTTK